MKLKCVDGKVRDFYLPGYSDISGWYEAECSRCGKKFGVHDTYILKPLFKSHTCGKKERLEK